MILVVKVNNSLIFARTTLSTFEQRDVGEFMTYTSFFSQVILLIIILSRYSDLICVIIFADVMRPEFSSYS